MKTLWGKFICFVTGKHRRGKRIGGTIVTPDGFVAYACPRCGTTWFRKSKPKPAPAIPQSIRKVGP